MSNEIQAIPDKSGKRRQILETAFRLFTENGFYATGVDLIMRQAGVSKRTMYIYFPTKNALIVAVLEHYRTHYERKLSDLLTRNNLTSREKILAIFDDAANWFGNAQFHGCLAVNAMGEFAGKDPAIEQACHVFKAWELGVFDGLTADLQVDNPKDLAYELLVLLEGIGAIAQVLKQPCPIDIRQMVNRQLDSHQALTVAAWQLPVEQTTLDKLIPGQPMPPIEFQTLQGNIWKLNAAPPKHFTLLVVYRGLHCPTCQGYLKQLVTLMPAFTALGVAVVAVSTDNLEQAEAAHKAWELDTLPLGYGLTISAARSLGLYISKRCNNVTPDRGGANLFAESGVFLVRPNGILYALAVNTLPLLSPSFCDILTGLNAIIKNEYFAQGEP